MRTRTSLRGFLIGVLVGVLAGSAGMAAAAIGYKGWSRFTTDFKAGYIAGFLDMASLARNLQPGGYVDEHYPEVPTVKILEWRTMVEELYQDPKNQKYSMTSLLQLAAHKLVEKHGKGFSPEERTLRRMQGQLEALKRRQEKAGIAPTPEKPKLLEAPAKVVAPPAKEDVRPKRKWCRCDGKIPKEERVRRKAEAESASDVEESGAAGAPKAAEPKVPGSAEEPRPAAK
ncbi:MAG: hypothetical protein ABR538_03725 [Candidatus Binatia bacterium]